MTIVRRTLIALLTITIAGLLFFHYTPLALDDVSFQQAATCTDLPAEGPATQGLLQSTGILVSHEANCAATMQAPAVQRVGSHLFVRLRFSYPDEMAGCVCNHRGVITGNGLTDGNPEVHVYAWP